MTYLFLAVFQTLYILVSYPLVKIVRIIIRICKTQQHISIPLSQLPFRHFTAGLFQSA